MMPKTIAEALDFFAGCVEVAPTATAVDVPSALGRILAEDVVAPVSLPRFDNAAMDGFAIRSEDIPENGISRLRVTQTIAAGHPSSVFVGSGEAALITTGSMMPYGADRVVVQENARLDGDEVHLVTSKDSKRHVRVEGGDVRAGGVLLRAGTRLKQGDIILLSALGLQSLRVRKRVRIGLLSTGDELRDIPEPLARGQLYDTNRPMLSMMLNAADAEVTDLGIVRDNADALLETLVTAAPMHDLLISSGGASAGFADHLTRAVSKRGHLEFWKLNMRPGKPIGFGDIDDCPILVLPGNPLAAAAGFALLGRPLIRHLSGGAPDDHSHLVLPIGSSIAKPLGRTQVLPGRLAVDQKTGATFVDPLPERGSASLLSLAQATVLIVLSDHRSDIEPGNLVDVIPLW